MRATLSSCGRIYHLVKLLGHFMPKKDPFLMTLGILRSISVVSRKPGFVLILLHSPDLQASFMSKGLILKLY